MSIYDTIRCLYHDPGYVWELHGDAIVGGSAVLAIMFAMWGY